MLWDAVVPQRSLIRPAYTCTGILQGSLIRCLGGPRLGRQSSHFWTAMPVKQAWPRGLVVRDKSG